MFLLQSDIFLWDLSIILLIVFTLAGAISCHCLIKRKKHSSLQTLFIRLAGGISLLGCFLVIYGSFIEPQMITVTEKTISHPLASPLKIAVISDIHVGAYKGEAFVAKAVQRVNALLPDIVLIPGDFILNHDSDLGDLDPLKNLRTTMGTFAVLGNHDVGEYETLLGKRYTGTDRGERISSALRALGITMLRNQSEVLTLPQGKLAIAGIDDIWTGHADLTGALAGIDPTVYTILLSHNPSVIDEPESLNSHLVVSGHTHGGQIRIPGFGPLSRLPTSLGQKYDQGVFEIDDDTALAISRGIGESSARTRLFATPEILLLRIQ
jgi:predicted MPP superfamily phosphohydrolase